MDEGLLSIREAMSFLRIGRSTLYELMEQGLIPWSKIGRSRRIPKRALVRLAQLTLRGGAALEILEETPNL